MLGKYVKVIRRFRKPIVSTSANISDEPSQIIAVGLHGEIKIIRE